MVSSKKKKTKMDKLQLKIMHKTSKCSKRDKKSQVLLQQVSNNLEPNKITIGRLIATKKKLITIKMTLIMRE